MPRTAKCFGGAAAVLRLRGLRRIHAVTYSPATPLALV
jgi:hypothetical protein